MEKFKLVNMITPLQIKDFDVLQKDFVVFLEAGKIQLCHEKM